MVYPSVDAPKTIPDQATITSTLQINDSVTIDDVDVQLDISHGSDSDLDVFLIAPDGTRVELFTDVGGGGDDFAGTTLDDEAATSIASASAPFTGSFQPEGSLAALDGKDSQGTWTLEITDDKRRNAGTLNSWSLSVTSAGPTLPSVSIADASATEGSQNVQFIDNFIPGGLAGLDSPRGLTIGPDGNLYVASSRPASVLRYDGQTGAFLGQFADASTAGTDPRTGTVLFGPDGNLYVTTAQNDSVLRFDGTTGTLIDEFVVSGSGGLDVAFGMDFGPNGDLYVTSQVSDEVLRYSGDDGAFLGVYVTAGSGGLDQPNSLTFGDDGQLYVGSSGTNEVLRYQGPNDPARGAFVNAFVGAGSGGLIFPPAAGLIFGPDGDLYVSSRGSDAVLRYDGASGAFLNAVVPPGEGGLDGPKGITFAPDGTLLVASDGNDAVLRYGVGSLMAFTVSLSVPSSTPVTVDFDTADGTARVVDGDYAATSGTVVFDPGVIQRTILVSTLDDAVIEVDETFVVNLSNASAGVTIADALGEGTIADDENPAPVAVSTISPDSIPAGSSMVSVTIIGSGFQTGATVAFEAFPGATPVATNVVVIDTTTITADVSVGTNGPNKDRVGDVRVTNPDGSTDSCVGCFTVTVGAASSATTANVVTVTSSIDTDDSLAATGDTSDPAGTTGTLPAADTNPLPQPTQSSGSNTGNDTDLIDLVFTDPATLDDPLLGELATALAG